MVKLDPCFEDLERCGRSSHLSRWLLDAGILPRYFALLFAFVRVNHAFLAICPQALPQLQPHTGTPVLFHLHIPSAAVPR
jgi:hypothetical protein